MLKNILNLGAEQLTKDQQKAISGGIQRCRATAPVCPPNLCCSKGLCYPYGTPGHLCDLIPIPDPYL